MLRAGRLLAAPAPAYKAPETGDAAEAEAAAAAAVEYVAELQLTEAQLRVRGARGEWGRGRGSPRRAALTPPPPPPPPRSPPRASSHPRMASL